MKSILLASVSTVAFAGAAAAEITFSGSAELGYNDTDQATVVANGANGTADDDFGFYSDLELDVTFSQELDNGLTVGASIDVTDLTGVSGNDYELSLTSSTAGLYYGDTAFAAETHWVSAGDMEADGFSEADGEEALRGDVTFGSVSASVSYVLGNNAGNANTVSDLNQLSFGATADFGNVNVVVAYQEASGEAAGFYSSTELAPLVPGTAGDGDNGDFNDAEVFGISVGTSFGGADVRLAYADNSVDDSIGVKVSYPVGPVTLTAYYVSESQAAGDNWGINAAYSNGPIGVELDYQDDQGVEKWSLEGSYDVGNGLTIYAGVDDAGDDYYVGGEYDLGGGAALLVSYADDSDGDEDDDDDDIGTRDYQVGTTVEVSFEF